MPPRSNFAGPALFGPAPPEANDHHLESSYLDARENLPKSAHDTARHEAKVTTNGDDAASHSGGRGTSRSGGRDRRDGPTHARGRL